ncbi:hypothetical protein BJH93_01195 [Kocuria polaris]|nr:hypothetical protein [Kocuria polaris]
MSLSIDSVRLAGPGVAAILLTVISNGAVILVSAAMSILSATIILGLRLPPLPGSSETKVRQIAEGFSFAFRQRWLVVTAFSGMFVTGAWMAGYSLIGPVQAHENYNGSTFWGICGMFFTAGLIAGGLVAYHFAVKNPVTGCIIASCGLAIPLVALGLVSTPVVVYASLFVASSLLSLAMTWWSTGVSFLVEKQFLARAFAFNSVVEFVGIPLAYVVVGGATAAFRISPEIVQFILVGTIVLATFFNLLLLRRFRFASHAKNSIAHVSG